MKHPESFGKLFPTTKRVTTLEELGQFGIFNLRDDEDPGCNPGYIFRGELDYECPLQSSLERRVRASSKDGDPVSAERLREEERRIIEEFVRGKGPNVAAVAEDCVNGKCPPPEDVFRWLSLMQHYNNPTRLIDFTRDIRIALFFAIEHHAKSLKSLPALRTQYLIIYCFPCFGFGNWIQNKTPIAPSEGDKIDMNQALGCQIGLSWMKVHDCCKKRPSPLRKFGWDRPYHQNHRLRFQKGMFVYPYDDPQHGLGGNTSSWLVRNLSEDSTDDPFKFGSQKKRLDSIRIEIPFGQAESLRKQLKDRFNLTQKTVYPDFEIART
jgi:hypothetical protein